jgi:hypothetical protein
MNPIKTLFLLLAVYTMTSFKAQVPCDSSNSPTFQVTTSQITLATNGVCGMQVNIINAATYPFPGGPVSYSFIAPGGMPTTSVIPSVAGVWTLQVMDNTNLCVTSQTILVTVLQAPIISVVANNTLICSGRINTLTASGANSYTWNTNATTSSITVIPTTTFTYSVIGTGTNICANTGYFTLNVNPSPTLVTTANPNSACANEPVTLTASGANTYTWSTSQTGASITVIPTANTNYTLSGTNEFGCETSREVLVTVLPCTEIDELKMEHEAFKIFPNPANDFIVLEITNTESLREFTSILIYNNIGQKILEEVITNKGSFKIETEKFESGVYYLQLKSEGNKTTSKRVVIAR